MSRQIQTKYDRELRALANEHGWELGTTRKGHRVFRRPGEQVFASKTPSDWRTTRNLKAQLSKPAEVA